ncbi:DUF6113 family protein [Jatrophihabitans sp.]|uniref:DUF6113 family protein n=1 Tax=Jatrophihabitans sp. TaxID=1932789 RepID=UPI002C8831B0|nr:DUF6113 family protein [Jatrophihabitans sp.]
MSRRDRAAEPVAAQRVEARPAPRPGPGLLALGYLLFAVAGAMTAAIEVLLVPSRIGQTLVPLAPALAVLSNVALPMLSRGLTDTRASAVPPYAGWLVTTLVLAGARPEGDVLLPAGDAAYISYSLLGLGTLAGAVTVARANRAGRLSRPDRLSFPRGRAGSGSDGAR